MREILFRGKRIDNGEWIEGSYMKHINRTPCPIGDDVRESDIEHIILKDGFSDWNLPRGIVYTHVDPATVGQYTGLKDKNGKRIFEGDIVVATNRRRLSNKPSVVEFSPHGGYWNCAEAREPVVIGNIHDNPELLGGNE